jgi:photosystem II stability/assembly factor-like uncharacterized protein
MEKSGEKAPVLEEYQTSPTDYASFLKAKAWNQRTSSFLKNATDLDISIIGGRVRSTLVDITNNIALIAPSGGGLWKFTPVTGTPFTPINDFGSFMPVTEIAQNPFTKTTILVATGDENHGIVGSGVYQSTNSGATFTQLAATNPLNNADFNYIRYLKYSPQTSGVIYLAARSKVYKSSNSGTSWTLVFDAGNGFNIHSIDFLANSGVIVSVDNKGLYSSTTGDASSFSLITTTIPNSAAGNSTFSGVVVATHAADRKIAYTLFTGKSTDQYKTNTDIYKTTDGGATWTKLTTPAFAINQTTFSLCLAVHPTDPSIVVGGSYGWGYSKNGCTSWVVGGDLEVDFHSINFHSSNPNMAYIGYDQGFGSVNFAKEANVWVWNGSTYVQEMQAEQMELGKTKGFNSTQIYYGDYFPQAYGDGYLEGQQDGGCFGKINTLESRILVGDGASIFINKQDPNKAFASTQNGNITATTTALSLAYNSYSSVGSFYNNHTNWITQFAGNNADGAQLYTSDKTSIQRTLNSGTSFSSIATHALNSVKVATQHIADPTVYAIGRNSTNWDSDLICIKSAAVNPSTVTSSTIITYNTDGTPDQITVDPNDATTIYITGSRGTAYKVTKANTASPVKTAIKGNIPTVVFNTVIGVLNKPNVLIAGTNVGLFTSEDNGVTWVLNTSIPYTQITDLKLRNSDNRLFVFTHGRGAWAITLDFTLTYLEENETSFVKIYPNPSNGNFNISTENKNTSIKIFDIDGKNVFEKSNISNENIKLLSKGLYILHITEENKLVKTEKIIVE